MTVFNLGKLRSGHPTLRLALIAALAILLHAAIVWMYEVQYYLWHYSNYLFFALPVLNLLALVVAVEPQMTFWEKHDRIASIGMSMLLVLIPNAFLRVVDLLRLGGTCEGPDYFKYESL